MTQALIQALALGAAAGAALLFGGAQADAATIVVTINDLAFDPAVVEARAGDVIEWRNADFVGHTATERGRQWDVVLPAGETRRMAMTRPGVMAYFCRFHPQMTGTIRVEPKH
ncbi:cupredoxin domain-containing protein [Labrys neptuniae]